MNGHQNPGRLRKPVNHERKPSGFLFPPCNDPLLTHDAQKTAESFPKHDILVPPPLLSDRAASRSSSPTSYRPNSRHSSRPVTPSLEISTDLSVPSATNDTKKKRKSWLFGRSGKDSSEDKSRSPSAWIVGHDAKVPYNLSLLLNAEKVPELWDDAGDTYVYLFPNSSAKGPSFKVDSSAFASSGKLVQLAQADIYSSKAELAKETRQTLDSAMQGLSLQMPTSSPLSPNTRNTALKSSGSSRDPRTCGTRELHLYLPAALGSHKATAGENGSKLAVSSEDTSRLVTIRNLFAFLVGQSVVATERRPTIFSVFLTIADLLKHYEFSNIDGSTYGEVASMSFDAYVEELRLADVRSSREKTIEGIILGERMRSTLLYNEAFVHGVGKYDDIVGLESPKFTMIISLTRNRMERAYMDLVARIKSIYLRLEDFEFPSIFAGIMNSKTADESRTVHFNEWKASFLTTRKHVMSFYRHKYGSWPPRASSKKNNLETSGLNRLVLRDIYNDLSCLYDLLVDRTSLTTRSEAGIPAHDWEDPIARALRRVLSEYDRSFPPVQPPVPFDISLLPTLRSTRPVYGTGDSKKDAKARTKKLKDEEIRQILQASHNRDSEVSTPFLDAFAELERRQAHGCTLDELCDLRVGQWLFLYVVLQSLPMLVVETPGVQWTHGVEYFLCEPPRGGVPWAREDAAGVGKKSWYGVSGGTGVVSLPSDVVEHGVEGVYRRSHCWLKAEKWSAQLGDEELASAVLGLGEDHAPLSPPPAMGALLGEDGGSRPGSRPSSPSRARNRDSVMMLGLEQLPLPAGVASVQGAAAARPVSAGAAPTGMTFDDILGTSGQGQGGRKGKKR